jgi:hypothetical protein
LARDRSRTPQRQVAFVGLAPRQMRLNVQTPKANTIKMDVNTAHTVDWVTALIGVKEPIPSDHHLFVKLEGGRPLSDYNLPEGARVYLMKTSYRIKVKPQEGEVFQVDVEAGDTIGNVKAKIELITKLPPRTQSLGFQRKEELLDWATLSDYAIKSLSLVRLTWTDEGQDAMEADDN